VGSQVSEHKDHAIFYLTPPFSLNLKPQAGSDKDGVGRDSFLFSFSFPLLFFSVIGSCRFADPKKPCPLVLEIAKKINGKTEK